MTSKLKNSSLHTLMMGAILTGAALPAAAAPSAEIVSTAADRQAMAITVYNDNLALVKDSRHVSLRAGESRLAWREVSAQMRPETAQLRNPSNPGGFRLYEQNFDFDLLTPAKLLDRHVGREVTVIRVNPATGAEAFETATVLAANSGTVLQFADRIETGTPERMAFSAVPATLRDKPTLTMAVANEGVGQQSLELSYLTGGLSWRADYVAELGVDDTSLDLNGWVTLTNKSGAAYPDAKLQLVAGDVNRVHEPRPMPREMMTMAAKAADGMEMQQESLLEYHLYTLPRLTTLAENQTKQVALLSATRIPVKKEFLLAGDEYYYSSQAGDLGQRIKVGVFVEFDNKGGGLGMPLPKGVIRVYKKDGQGNAQFVGEDRIDHTPKGERVRLKLGEAFDVTADKKQTAFQRLPGSGRHSQVFESAYEIELKNAKSEAVTVTVREPMPGDWAVVGESHPHAKVSSGVAQWKLAVPAEGKVTLSYRARVRY